MYLSGIKDLLKFVEYLRSISSAPWYRLTHSGDWIMVDIATPGARIEVFFYEDHVEYSVFNGTEDVLDDQEALLAMLKDS